MTQFAPPFVPRAFEPYPGAKKAPTLTVGPPRAGGILWRMTSYLLEVRYHVLTPFSPERYTVPAFTVYADRHNSQCLSIGNREVIQVLGLAARNIYFDLQPGKMASYWTDDPEQENIDLGQFFASNCLDDQPLQLHVTVYNATFL